MIDLTPLDVRKKRGDFRKLLRGYDPDEVDAFIELVAERLEELVKENLTLRERSDRLKEQVESQEGREKAVQDALVTAQELRDDIRNQAQQEADDIRAAARREADLLRKEAESEVQRITRELQGRIQERQEALEELERHRMRFLKGFRSLLERELDAVEVEEGRTPLEEVEIELDLGGPTSGRGAVGAPAAEAAALDPGPEDDVVLDAEALAPDTDPGSPPPLPEASHEETEGPDPAAPVHDLAAEVDDGAARTDDPGGSPDSGADLVSDPGAEPPDDPSADAHDRRSRDELWLSSILKDDPDSPFGDDEERGP